MGQEQARIIRQIAGLSEISDHYDVILCDIWGVLHNGVASFTQASDALVSFRRRGGAVILISNAPRPSPPIARQVLKLGVSPDAFDAVVTSGDVTIGLMEQQAGDRVLHIGPERDLTLLDAVADASGARPKLVSVGVSQTCDRFCVRTRSRRASNPRFPRLRIHPRRQSINERNIP